MSTDGGTVWNIIDSYFPDGGALATDPNASNILWSGGIFPDSGINVMTVAKTTDYGTTWSRYIIGQLNGITRSLAVKPANSNIVFAGGCENNIAALYATSNGGSNWTISSAGINGDTVLVIAFDPQNSSVMYCGTSSGVFKSTDSGTSWTNKGCSNVRSLLVNPNFSDTVYAGTNYGVLLSTDQGNSWTPMNDGLNDTYVYCLGIHNSNYLFAATEMGGMYRWDLNTGISDRPVGLIEKQYSGATIFKGPLFLPEGKTCRVFDITGRQINDFDPAPGIYFIEIENKIIHKVIKIE